jgi:hypothetical protein
MASPGFTRHLNDLLGQFLSEFSRLAALMRSPSRASVPAAPAEPLAAVAICPQAILRQVGLSLGDEAFFYRVDVMRRYRWDVPLLCVDAVMLTSVLTDLVRGAITACGHEGAVICDLGYDGQGLRLAISDSSGVTGQTMGWWEGSSRYRHLARLEQDVIRLGGQQRVSVFEGEGVVVELRFPAALCLGPERRTRHLVALNEPHRPLSVPIGARYHPRRP